MIDINPPRSRPAISFLPTTAVLEMTYACNHKCLFCSCPWENPAGPFRKERELTTDEWKEAIDLISKMGITDVCFTGGEALLRKDIWEIIEYAASLHGRKIIYKDHQFNENNEPFRLYMISNGRKVDQSILEKCKKFKVQLSMSLPGLRSFREMTGDSDPDKILANFSAAKKLGLYTVVNITVTKKNLSELYETISAAFLAGADQLLLNAFLKGGRGLLHAKDLELTQEEILAALDTAEQVLLDSGRFGSIGTELPKCLLNGKTFQKLDVATQCSAGVGFFVIGPSGKVRVCNHSQIELCHFREIDRLKTHPYWQKFTQKSYLPEKCFTCSMIGSCDGGCREEAHILSGKVNGSHHLIGKMSK
jgi:radical SAM protein with 4Fe4S-binding SPASM domain